MGSSLKAAGKRKRQADTSAPASAGASGFAQRTEDMVDIAEDSEEIRDVRSAKKLKTATSRTDSNAEDNNADSMEETPTKQYTPAGVEAFYAFEPSVTHSLSGSPSRGTDGSVMSVSPFTNDRTEGDTDPEPLSEENAKLARLLAGRQSSRRRNYLIFDFEKKAKKAGLQSTTSEIEAGIRDAEIQRFKVHRASSNVISFKKQAGDTRRGHPSRPVLSRELAVQHFSFLRDALMADGGINTIEYPAEINESTVTRLIACISPTVRSALPTHDVVEVTSDSGRDFRCTPIQWSMQELENLYIFAHHTGCLDVCDMIIDRLHQELHREWPRRLYTEEGTTEAFNILGFPMVFFEYLSNHDSQGCSFLMDVLIVKAEAALPLLLRFDSEAWGAEFKEELMTRLEFDKTPAAGETDADAVCTAYHHHDAQRACYRTKALSNVQVSDPVLKAPRLPTLHATDKKDKRWAMQRAFQAKSRTIKKRNFPTRGDEEAEMLTQRRLQERYDGSSDDSSDSEDLSDDEDSNVVTLGLPDLYADSRASPESDDQEPYVPYQYADILTKRKLANPGRDLPLYLDEGLNGYQDTEDMASRKIDIVEAKLEEFRDFGYDVDLGSHSPSA